jgi:hypothetical protein
MSVFIGAVKNDWDNALSKLLEVEREIRYKASRSRSYNYYENKWFYTLEKRWEKLMRIVRGWANILELSEGAKTNPRWEEWCKSMGIDAYYQINAVVA